MQPTAFPTEDATADATGSAAYAGLKGGKTTVDFLWKVHDLTANDIRFADTKAVMSIGFCSALISGIFAAKLQRFILTGLSFTNVGFYETLMGVGTTLSLLMLGGAVLSSVWAFIPRLWDKRLPTLWLRVQTYFLAPAVLDARLPVLGEHPRLSQSAGVLEAGRTTERGRVGREGGRAPVRAVLRQHGQVHEPDTQRDAGRARWLAGGFHAAARSLLKREERRGRPDAEQLTTTVPV